MLLPGKGEKMLWHSVAWAPPPATATAALAIGSDDLLQTDSGGGSGGTTRQRRGSDSSNASGSHAGDEADESGLFVRAIVGEAVQVSQSSCPLLCSHASTLSLAFRYAYDSLLTQNGGFA